MREIQCAVVDIDHYLEEAARAKHQLDAEHWRDVLRPRAMRLFTVCTSRARLSPRTDPPFSVPRSTQPDKSAGSVISAVATKSR